MNQDAKKLVKIIGIIGLFLFILIFGIFGARDLIFGVKIKNVNLVDGATMTENPITITGNAQNAVNLTLNGREISIDQAGNFNETFALISGYNIINITARDKFGYIDEKNYQLIYQSP